MIISRRSALATTFAGVIAAPLPRAQARPFRIGVLNDQSGFYADSGGLGGVTAVQMAVKDFGGSVLGRPIEILSADHQNKPDIGSAVARRWFDAEGVDVIVDPAENSHRLGGATGRERTRQDHAGDWRRGASADRPTLLADQRAMDLQVLRHRQDRGGTGLGRGWQHLILHHG